MSAGPDSGDVAVVIPARNEADRIEATVTAALGLPAAAVVIVVDDGSTDGTAAAARSAGAVVTRHARNRGKGAALETGAAAVRLLDQREQRDRPRHLLFLDADLGGTAAQAGPLTEPVLAGAADMTIAVFATTVKLGGHGLVLGLSRAGIRRATGWRPPPPLNGPRCLTRAAFPAARLEPAVGDDAVLPLRTRPDDARRPEDCPVETRPEQRVRDELRPVALAQQRNTCIAGNQARERKRHGQDAGEDRNHQHQPSQQELNQGTL